MTDCDFKAASNDGFGDDWPISYSDIVLYYDRVEEFMGVYGSQDKVPNLPDGKYFKEPKLTAAEQTFKANVESQWPDRKVVSWKVQRAPNLKRVPMAVIVLKEPAGLPFELMPS